MPLRSTSVRRFLMRLGPERNGGGQDLQPRAGVRVSLSDAQGEVINQQVTEGDGRFSFDHLPMALYWVTGRREDAARTR